MGEGAGCIFRKLSKSQLEMSDKSRQLSRVGNVVDAEPDEVWLKHFPAAFRSALGRR